MGGFWLAGLIGEFEPEGGLLVHSKRLFDGVVPVKAACGASGGGL